MTAYAAGLRVSEICHLQVADIDSGRMCLRVDQGTGNKDRYVLLSQRLLAQLRHYWCHQRPRSWLFPGRYGDRPMSRDGAAFVYRSAKRKAGITKSGGIHTITRFRPNPACRAQHFQDQARIGPKGMLSRVWARKGTRPRIVRDCRYGYDCLFSAACPGDRVRGRACLREDQNRRDEPPSPGDWRAGSHGKACPRLPRRRWHRSRELEIPANVSLPRLPPCSPELNRVETPFPVLNHPEFATRMFESAADVGRPSKRCGRGSPARQERSCRSRQGSGPCREVRARFYP